MQLTLKVSIPQPPSHQLPDESQHQHDGSTDDSWVDFKLDSQVKVSDAIEIIRDAYSSDYLNDLQDKRSPRKYGLWVLSEDSDDDLPDQIENGQWLDDNMTLDNLLVKDNYKIVFKNKMRELYVKTLDETEKKFPVDFSKEVKKVVQIICHKMGIQNDGEYSFCKNPFVDDFDNISMHNGTIKSNYGTMKGGGYETLGRGRLDSSTLKKAEKKMTMTDKAKEKLKAVADKPFITLQKRVFTDDKIQWLNPSDTLSFALQKEEKASVILRRRYFFSDTNVAERDPKQLMMLYKQCQDSVIKEEYPVTKDVALQLAGIHARIDYGAYGQRNDLPWGSLAELLPNEIIKNAKKKDLEKAVVKEWKDHSSDLFQTDTGEKADPSGNKRMLQLSYIKICRNMPTYGVTCFLVKEKERGKNRMKPRLLGISKSHVFRLTDEREVEFKYPLESIKNWAAGKNNVTLNFGDYKKEELNNDGIYSVKTTEGERILSLINGYIQIIMENRKAGDKFDDPSPNTQFPEIINNPSQQGVRVIFSEGGNGKSSVTRGTPAVPGVLNPPHGAKQIQMGEMREAQSAEMKYRDLPQPKQSRLIPFHTTVKQNLQQIPQIEKELNKPITLEPHPIDEKHRQEKKGFNEHQTESHVAQIAAETARIINQYPVDSESSLAPAVTGLVSELSELPGPVRALAALQIDEPEQSRGILKAADDLLKAVSGLLISAQENDNEDLQLKKRSIQMAAIEVSSALGDVLNYVRSSTHDNGQRLVELASAVPFATQELVKNVQEVISADVGNLQDMNSPQSKLIVAATKAAQAASQLVTVAKVTAPTIHDPACQKQLTDAMKDVSVAINLLVMESSWLEPQDLDKLKESTGKVSVALEALINHMKKIVTPRGSSERYDDLLAKTGTLATIDDPEELIIAVKDISQSTVSSGGLVHALKLEGDSASDRAKQERLHAAAKSVMLATQGVVQAARSIHDNQNGPGQLANAARELQSATESAIQLREKRAAAINLCNASKQAATAATQMIAPVRVSGSHNSNPIQANNLNIQNKALQKQVPALVKATRALEEKQENSTALQALIDAAKDFVEPAQKTVRGSKSAQPTVSDSSAKAMLRNASEKLALAVNSLTATTQRAADVCETSPLDTACDKVGDVVQELATMKDDARRGKLKPSREQSGNSMELGKAVKQSIAVVPQVLSAAAHSDDVALNSAATAASDAAVQLKESVKANCSDPTTASIETIGCGHSVAESIQRLLLLCRDERDNESHNKKNKLVDMAKELTTALSDMFNCIPGQREIELSTKFVKDSYDKFDQLAKRSPPHGTYSSAANELKLAAEDTNQAAGNIVGAASGELQDVVLASQEYAQDFECLVAAGIKVASHTAGADRQDVIDEMAEVSSASSRLLGAAKDIATDMGNSSYRQALTSAAKGVTDAINDLISKCVAAAPGQASCESAIRKLNNAKSSLQSDLPPAGSQKDYFTILNDIITEHSRALSDSMRGLYSNAKEQNSEAFNNEVERTSSTLVKLTEEACAAAYIVGVSDRRSLPGTDGLVDQAKFQRASEAIKGAVTQLGPNSSQENLMAAVTTVAKQTTNLCQMCSSAADKTTRPEQRNQFKQGARELGQATTELVGKFRIFTQDPSHECMAQISEASMQLKRVTSNLTDFAASPEFASVAPQFSAEAKDAQRPILEAGSSMLDGGSDMINILKNYIQNPQVGVEMDLHAASRKVSDSIKDMIKAIREAAPGQRECDNAIDSINGAFRQLNEASLDSLSNVLDGDNFEGSLRTHTDDLNNILTEIEISIDPVAFAAKGKAAQLGRSVTQTSSLVSHISYSTIAAASKLNPSKQDDLINFAKTVLENLLQLIYSVKESGGNPNFKTTHDLVDKASEMLKESIKEYRDEINDSPAATANNLINAVEQATNALDAQGESTTNQTQNQLQSELTKECRALNQIAQCMTTAPVGEIPELSKKSVVTYQQLCSIAQFSHRIADSHIAANSIKGKSRTCGSTLVSLINSSLTFTEEPNDLHKRDLHEKCRRVADSIQGILAILSVSSASAQATHKLTTQIERIIQDVDTDILFAQSGTLVLEAVENVAFDGLMGDIAKYSRGLTEDIRALVRSVEATDNNSLKVACESSGIAVDDLTHAVKLTARYIAKEGTDTQVALLNVAKSVVVALHDLIKDTRTINGQFSDANIEMLKSSSTKTVLSITKLIKAIQIIREDQSRGPQELKRTIESITRKTDELKFENIKVREGTAEPEKLIAATKPLTMAASRAVAVGKSGNTSEIISLCSVSVDIVGDLVQAVKNNAEVTSSDQLRSDVLAETTRIVNDFNCALNSLHERIINGDSGLELTISQYSQRVATGIARLCRAAPKLKGEDWEDPNDPNVMAERELTRAAKAIDAAASKLQNLTPRKEANSKVDENLNFDEQILDAARSIALATKLLVQKASAAQKELVLEGRLQVTGHSKDKTGQFSHGLVSAAQMVAGETGSMCEAANDLVKGIASEERLEASAMGVSTATGQLLIACKVKAEPDSEAMKRLDIAGAGVRKASENLVKASSAARENKEVAMVFDYEKRSNFQVKRDEVTAREELLQAKRQFEQAQLKLQAVNKERYVREAKSEEDH